jgi:hypothetical protein
MKPRLLSGRAVLLLATSLLAPLLATGALRPVPVQAAPPQCPAPGFVCVVSSSQWIETFREGGRVVHIVGEVRNDSTGNLTSIRLNFDLLDATRKIGTSFTHASAEILGPGELSPFEELLSPPTGYVSFQVSSITATASVSQPYHSFEITRTSCLPTDPLQQICGTVKNTGPITVDGVRALLTFRDGAGKVVAQDTPEVLAPDGTSSTLGPGVTGKFRRDRSGDPTFFSVAYLAEPSYPVDLNPLSLDFGSQLVGTVSAEQSVSLRNNGSRPLAATLTTSIPDFQLTSNCPASLPGTSGCVIKIKFAPSEGGPRSGNLIVTSDGAGGPQSIPLSGKGIRPIATVTPAGLVFDARTVGTTSPPQVVTVKNDGDGPMTISAVSAGAPFAAVSACPASLDPGFSCTINVTFTPTQTGPVTGTLSITDSAPLSPHQVALSGGGGITPPTSAMIVSTAQLKFGDQNLGAPATPAQTVTVTNSGSAPLTITGIAVTGDFSETHTCPAAPATLAPAASCTINVTFKASVLGPRTGTLTITSDAPIGSSWTVSLSGNGFAPTLTLAKTSTAQYRLQSSNGTDWKDMDTANLQLTIDAAANGTAVLSANADLWTAQAGYNQDLGIFVSVDGGPSTLLAWKESGGFAGTFSPNAAFVQGMMPVSYGKKYVVTLKWKTNKDAPGVLIVAGAGPIPIDSNNFSPTRLTAQLLPQGVSTKVSTDQYRLAGSDGATWVDIDTAKLSLTLRSATDSSAVLSGNADLWTAVAGLNQDIAIEVDGVIVAWKESGGFAGTFSPNAAFVQTTIPMPANTTRVVKLKWKTNVAAGATATILAGAGLGPFSHTALTAILVPNASVTQVVSKSQYRLPGSDGVSWIMIDPTGLALTVTPATSSLLLSGNVDLWTANAGFNQDVALFIGGNEYGAGILVSWKESGGFAGTFSPNAAFVQGMVAVMPGKTYTVTLRWKTNVSAAGALILAGAGPIPAGSSTFSPTTLIAQEPVS